MTHNLLPPLPASTFVPPIVFPFPAGLFFVLLLVLVFVMLPLLQGSQAILLFWLCCQAAAFCNGAVASVFPALSALLDQPKRQLFCLASFGFCLSQSRNLPQILSYSSHSIPLNTYFHFKPANVNTYWTVSSQPPWPDALVRMRVSFVLAPWLSLIFSSSLLCLHCGENGNGFHPFLLSVCNKMFDAGNALLNQASPVWELQFTLIPEGVSGKLGLAEPSSVYGFC